MNKSWRKADNRTTNMEMPDGCFFNTLNGRLRVGQSNERAKKSIKETL